MGRKKAKNNNFYFDNQLVEELIEKYRKSNFQDKKVLEQIMKHLDKLIYAIINKYSFYKYGEYDDLFQHGRLNCLISLPYYDPKKVLQKNKSVFSYFSNVIKKSIRTYTINENKKRFQTSLLSDKEFLFRTETNSSSNENANISNENNKENFHSPVVSWISNSFSLNEIEKNSVKIIVHDLINFLKKYYYNKRRFYNLVVIFEKYLEQINPFGYKDFKFKDFVAYAQSYGYSLGFVKKFFSQIKKFKNLFL